MQNATAMLKPLDPLLHSELRLGIMSILMTAESADFVFIREATGATAGNLSVQIDKLAQAGYLTVRKTYKGRRPQTLCSATPKGRDAFAAYVEALQGYIAPKGSYSAE